MTTTETAPRTDPEALRRRALEALTVARDRTALLTSCVDDGELNAQHSPLMSPLVWDLAHIGNQEEQWLWRAVAGREALRPEIDSLYDAFEHPRATRPSLPLLAPGRPAPTRRTCGSGSSTCWSARPSRGGRCSTPPSRSA